MTHDNAWYIQNFAAQTDFRARAADLRDQARHLLLEATSLDALANELAQLSSVFEGQAISVTESGKDQFFLKSLPVKRAAMVFRDRKATDGSWTGILEDQSGESGVGVGVHARALPTGLSKDDALLLAKQWVAHGVAPTV